MGPRDYSSCLARDASIPVLSHAIRFVSTRSARGLPCRNPPSCGLRCNRLGEAHRILVLAHRLTFHPSTGQAGGKILWDPCRQTNRCLSSTCFRWHLGELGSRSSRDSIYVAIRCYTPGWGLRHSSWDIHPSGPHTRASDRRLFSWLQSSGMTQLRTQGPCEAPGRNQAADPWSPGGMRGRDFPACAPRLWKAAPR